MAVTLSILAFVPWIGVLFGLGAIVASSLVVFRKDFSMRQRSIAYCALTSGLVLCVFWTWFSAKFYVY
jgi:membrane protein DedA with SNARE-associated domain